MGMLGAQCMDMCVCGCECGCGRCAGNRRNAEKYLENVQKKRTQKVNEV